MAYQPKSYRKFIATAATATLVASAVAPAAAATPFTDVPSQYEAAVQYLVDNKITVGKDADTFGTYDNIIRADAAVWLANALGLDTANAPDAGFTDVPARAQGAANALKAAGITSGKTATTFGANDTLTRGEMAIWLQKAYKLTGEADLKFTDVASQYEAAVEALVANKITSGKTETSYGTHDQITRGELAIFLHRAETLPAATPEVVSVSAINLKQVQVTLAGNVDLDEATDAANYTFEDANGNEIDVENAELPEVSAAASNTVVTLTLKTAVKNQGKATITVDEVVTGEEYTKEIEFFDIVIPEVAGASVVGNDTIKVKFSEPINYTDEAELKAAFELDEGKYFVKSVKPLKNNTEFNVEFYATLSEGEHTLSVDNSLKDYAGYSVVAKDVKVNVVPDKEAPYVASVKSASPTKVVLVFNEDIESISNPVDVTDFYHTNSKNTASNVKIEGKEVTLTFSEDYKLPQGTAYVYIKAETVRDLWDNENAQQIRVPVEVTVDETAPTVTKVEASKQNELKVTFSEELDATSAETEANYVLLDKDGKEVDIINVATLGGDDKNVVTITLDENIYGDHSLVVEKVKDLAGNATVKSTTTFSVADKTAPAFADFKATLYNDNTSVESLVINFGEPMSVSGANSVLDLSKYKVKVGAEWKSLNVSKGVKITALDNNRSVKIDINKADAGIDLSSDTAPNKSLQIAQVADAAGNKTVDFSGTVAIDKQTTFGAKSAKATATDKIVVTLADKVSKFNYNDFVFTGLPSGVVVSGATVDDSGATTVVTFSLSGKISTDVSGIKVSTRDQADVQTVNAFGSKLELTDYEVKDAVAPALALKKNAAGKDVANVEAIDNDTVVLNFTEEIDGKTLSTLSFEVQGFDVDNATVDTTDKKKVVLTVSPAETGNTLKTGLKVTQKYAIKDTDGNSVSDLATTINFTSVSAPAPTTVTGTVAFDNTTYTSTAAVTVTLTDADLNTDAATAQTATVALTDSATGSHTLTVTETGADTGVFTGTITLGTDWTPATGTITVTYNDAADASGNAVTATDTATVN
ncbi:S-layer homology domain-containing protein [Bacillus litorisediminis]|uniref:S-layer homology domain-containing protein n=1 Tax=Bacillus litorisediminis TaxID=2922713 RepID=UPI001FAE2692|nr:S-layer homology domain-containing protein [Bacillus litorisediminis]